MFSVHDRPRWSTSTLLVLTTAYLESKTQTTQESSEKRWNMQVS